MNFFSSLLSRGMLSVRATNAHTNEIHFFRCFEFLFLLSFAPSAIIVSLLLLLLVVVLAVDKCAWRLLQFCFFCTKERGRAGVCSIARSCFFARLSFSFQLSFVWNFRRSFTQLFVRITKRARTSTYSGAEREADQHRMKRSWSERQSLYHISSVVSFTQLQLVNL